jgi:hypothetical protein
MMNLNTLILMMAQMSYAASLEVIFGYGESYGNDYGNGS